LYDFPGEAQYGYLPIILPRRMAAQLCGSFIPACQNSIFWISMSLTPNSGNLKFAAFPSAMTAQKSGFWRLIVSVLGRFGRSPRSVVKKPILAI